MESEGKSIETKTPAAMEMETANDVLPPGPSPGKAICTFWQGRVEMALRFLALLVSFLMDIGAFLLELNLQQHVGSLPAFITAMFALIIPRFGDIEENVPVDINNILSPLSGAFLATFVFAIYVMVVTAMAIAKEIVLITLRFCNCGCANRGINVILIIAIIASFIESFAHFIGAWAVLGSAVTWGTEYNTLITGEKITLSLCAAFCFISTVLYLIQASWSITFLAKKWNKNVEKYTLEHFTAK